MQCQRIRVVPALGAECPCNRRRYTATHGTRGHHLHQHDDRENQRNARERIGAQLADEIDFDEPDCGLRHHDQHVRGREPQERCGDRRLEKHTGSMVHLGSLQSVEPDHDATLKRRLPSIVSDVGG